MYIKTQTQVLRSKDPWPSKRLYVLSYFGLFNNRATIKRNNLNNLVSEIQLDQPSKSILVLSIICFLIVLLVQVIFIILYQFLFLLNIRCQISAKAIAIFILTKYIHFLIA